MKKVIEIYCCDVCEKEVDGNKDLEKIVLPCKEMQTEVDVSSTFELCTECASKVRSLIFGSLAKIFIYENGDIHRVELPKTKPAEQPKMITKAAAALKEVAKAAVKTKTAFDEVTKAAEDAKMAAEPKAEPATPQNESKTNEEWGNEVREMLKNGKTVHEIALHYGLNKSTTYNRMNALGISPKQYRPR